MTRVPTTLCDFFALEMQDGNPPAVELFPPSVLSVLDVDRFEIEGPLEIYEQWLHKENYDTHRFSHFLQLSLRCIAQ